MLFSRSRRFATRNRMQALAPHGVFILREPRISHDLSSHYGLAPLTGEQLRQVACGDAGRFCGGGDYAAMRQRAMPCVPRLCPVDDAWISPAGGSFDWTRTPWTGQVMKTSWLGSRRET